MDGKSFFYGIIGFTLAVSLSSVYALTASEEAVVLDEQNYALKYTGSFQPVYDNKDYQVFTYETLCKGFYVVEDNGDSVRFTGFGDLADDYTYTYDKFVEVSVASSTDEKLPDSTPVIELPL